MEMRMVAELWVVHNKTKIFQTTKQTEKAFQSYCFHHKGHDGGSKPL